MHSELREKIAWIASTVEIVLGAIILVACIISSLGIVFTTNLPMLFGEPAYLQDRMSDICLIIIGVELIKMFTSDKLELVVDVMMLTIARQMIEEHTSPLENLLSVLAVGILFAILKYLRAGHVDGRERPSREKEPSGKG